ncbi:MAG TPA: hypothetical protein VJ203_05135 [Bacteroidales bacterium]|nr:hypothetical protein [Bacteroidales bacterium]
MKVERIHKAILEFLKQNRDDLEFLIFVGVPGGILMVLFSKCLNFINLF